MNEINVLRQKVYDAKDKGRAILDAATGRDLTADEETALEAAKAEKQEAEKVLDAAIKRANDELAFGTSEPARADHRIGQEHVETVGISGGEPGFVRDPKCGFSNLGELGIAVRQASRNGPGEGVVGDRLRYLAAPTTYGNEGVGADGGFLVPPEFSMEILRDSLEGDALLPMTNSINVSGNGMTFPVDETTPWGNNGVRAYWEAEAAQATQTKPVYKMIQMRLHKLFGIVPITDELLDDAAALSGELTSGLPRSIRWKSNDAIVNGTGAGQPTGFAGHASAVIVAAEAGPQAADTIVAANVVKMFARSTNPGGSVWLINPDAWHQLQLMTIGDQPVYLAPSMSIQAAPGGMLLGRPVIMSEHCQTLGDQGDMYFVDLMAYKTIQKAAGVVTAQSVHLWFDYDVTAFRATFRLDGQPWRSAAITPPNSTVTRSPFVVLGARTGS